VLGLVARDKRLKRLVECRLLARFEIARFLDLKFPNLAISFLKFSRIAKSFVAASEGTMRPAKTSHTREFADGVGCCGSSRSSDEMKIQRRQFLYLASGAATLPMTSGVASAQGYPWRPVRIIVGFAAGGTTDIVARLIAQGLSEHLGQQFVVENRPGAATNIATEAVVRSSADGYTLLAVTVSNTVNTTLFDKLSFNFVRDIAPVAGLISSPLVLEVNRSVPAQTVGELIAYAKANPGRTTLASFGTGTSSHVAGELFKMVSGINMVHVPYRGSAPMLTDLLGGQVQAAFDNLPASVEHIKAARLRALAVTTIARSAALPDVPTIGEFLPHFEALAWVGIGAPRNTPVSIIDKLNDEINTALAHPQMKARFDELGGTPMPITPAQFQRLIAADTEKWGEVIRAANIKAD
jgi:tripartite-type tricarboxylate transporter receptor subunit TctC